MTHQRTNRIPMKGIVGGVVVACSFGFGLWLGTTPKVPSPSGAAESARVARLFATPEPSVTAPSKRPDLQTAQPPKATKLRLRSTSKVSSREARSGDSVLFVTDQPVQTKTGQHVPAGALVEAVIAEAKPSSGQKPGSLVIEIRALHVGAKTIPLHALPYVPKTIEKAESQESAIRRRLTDPRSLRIRNQLTVNPDAVMPKEAVVEFHLVDGLDAPRTIDSIDNVRQPGLPAIPGRIDPPLQTSPLPMDTPPPPAPRGKAVRVATASA